MYADLALYIDGEWLAGGGRNSEPVINPATEKPLATLTHASPADLDRALAAAEKGYRTWRGTAPFERARVMRKAADLIRERLEAIARILTMEQGKTLAEGRVEVAVSADIIEWYAEEGKRSYGRVIPGRAAGVRQMTVQEPVGPCAAFTPWNFPGVTPARKIGGALGAGCSLIIKA
jgi:succinate-semialdehyde dehydrogenase / glutarate-semialdehyde dehydrogenase